MMRTGDHALLKELNQSIALNILRRHGPLSRTDMSKRSGLNKATISVIVDEFLKAGLAHELGRGESSIGRRPVLLEFNAWAGFTIGIEIAVGQVRGVMTNLNGTVYREVQGSLDDPASPRQALISVNDLLARLTSSVPDSPLGILGIGFGAPGLVNYELGTILNAPNLGWTQVEWRSLVEVSWPYPIYVDNEANAGALGEKLLGAAREVSSLVYISASRGIGAGIIMKDELVRGAQGLAGEFGHTVIQMDGRPCPCGNQGCLEAYASEWSLLNDFADQTGHRISLDQLRVLVEEGNPEAHLALEHTARALGLGVSNIVNALNPAAVIIGNRLSVFGDELLKPLSLEMQRRCFTLPHSGTSVRLAALGTNAIAVGAAALVLQAYFSAPKTM